MLRSRFNSWSWLGLFFPISQNVKSCVSGFLAGNFQFYYFFIVCFGFGCVLYHITFFPGMQWNVAKRIITNNIDFYNFSNKSRISHQNPLKKKSQLGNGRKIATTFHLRLSEKVKGTVKAKWVT